MKLTDYDLPNKEDVIGILANATTNGRSCATV